MASADTAPAGASGALDEATPGRLDDPQVRAMFDRIAGLYDRMNSVMTAGLHHHWRRRAADLAELSPGGRALDVATGTGDLALEYPDGSFDAATVGFGARNFSDLKRGLSEMARVVRPGGRVVVLEITTPRRPPLSTFFELWFDHAIPALGRVVDSQAYSYLPSSVRRFPGPEELAAIMSGCGLGQIRYVLTAGGIIALHVGVVLPR